MAYSSPATVVTGTTITSTWGNSVKTATDYLANPPACRVFHSAAQSIASATNTALAFNSERYDTNTMHDTVTNNSRITMNTAGLYIVTANIQLASDTDYTTHDVWILLNGVTTIANINNVNPGTAALSRIYQLVTTYKFAVTDYIQVMVRQVNTSAGANNVEVAANSSPEFAATWVGLG